MANIRELRGRIRSVKGISQITRAMEMVASTKLRRFQERAIRSRPYALEIEELVSLLAAGVAAAGSAEESGVDPLLIEAREPKRVAALLVASDRGLCGAYNANLFAAFERWRAEQAGREIEVFVIGRKGIDYIHKRGYTVAGYFDEVQLERMGYQDSVGVARALLARFQAQQVQQVHLIYTAFESVMRYVPTVTQLLPIDPGALAARGGASGAGLQGASGAGLQGASAAGRTTGVQALGAMLLEPDPGTIFSLLVPRYLETRVFNALMESLTSEYASRRISMKNATEAANEMVGNLRRIYNRVRQERITKELLEIVGGAEALKS